MLNWQVGDIYTTNQGNEYIIDAIKADRLYCISTSDKSISVLVCDMEGNSISINNETGDCEKLISLVDKSDTTYSIKKKEDK